MKKNDLVIQLQTSQQEINLLKQIKENSNKQISDLQIQNQRFEQEIYQFKQNTDQIENEKLSHLMVEKQKLEKKYDDEKEKNLSLQDEKQLLELQINDIQSKMQPINNEIPVFPDKMQRRPSVELILEDEQSTVRNLTKKNG